MFEGNILMEGSADKLANDEKAKKLYLGETLPWNAISKRDITNGLFNRLFRFLSLFLSKNNSMKEITVQQLKEKLANKSANFS